jgi:hypothetical protein
VKHFRGCKFNKNPLCRWLFDIQGVRTEVGKPASWQLKVRSLAVILARLKHRRLCLRATSQSYQQLSCF